MEQRDISQFRDVETTCANCGSKVIVKVSPRLKNIGKISHCENCPK